MAAVAELIVVSGPPGAGKSTVARLLADGFERSALVVGDEFFAFLRRGYVDPWLDEAHQQNEVVMAAAAAATGRLVTGGYSVVYDGVIGPWFQPVPGRDRAFRAAVRGVAAAAGLLPGPGDRPDRPRVHRLSGDRAGAPAVRRRRHPGRATCSPVRTRRSGSPGRSGSGWPPVTWSTAGTDAPAGSFPRMAVLNRVEVDEARADPPIAMVWNTCQFGAWRAPVAAWQRGWKRLRKLEGDDSSAYSV
jgi:hypothetical protein